jgi:glycerol-3-phosphate O-acyltransferase
LRALAKKDQTMNFRQRSHRLLQKILFLWVRVEVLPQPIVAENFATSPVLYVLEKRELSDMLVLERVARTEGLADPLQTIDLQGYKHHSIYSIASRNPVTDWLMRQKKNSLMLEELITATQTDENLDICIVPVSIFWGRPIAKQRHWLTVLFSDTWEVTSKFRKLFTILLHGRNTTLIFSEPQSLRKLHQTTDGSAEALNEKLAESLHRQREATFGPEISQRYKVINQIVESDSVQALIKDDAVIYNRSIKRVRKKATSYCREIISDSTQISQELMKRLLHAFWNRYYSGTNIFDIERVKKTALTHQIIYVPCHRSHVDYLLLSYIIFKQGLALPYIAAGDNLNMPIIGKILKGGGAFFIRRSFKDNALYSGILNEYIRQLVAMGAPIEYFIEGGRSRTGRLLKPKLGMLSMTVDAWIKTQNRPLAFIPVYIGYEKLIEGKSYIGELFGQKKKKESLFTSIRSILSLKGQFGKVTTRFGQPIELDKQLAKYNPDWQEYSKQDFKRQDWFRSAVEGLSHQIMEQINLATVINPVNLIATTLLATPRQSIDQFDLLQLCKFYQQLIQSQSHLDSIIIQDSVNEDELKRIEKQGLIHIHPHQLGNIIYLKPEHAALMSYYRNNSLHILIIPSIIACCFLNARTIAQNKLLNIVLYVYPFLSAELHLPWSVEQLEEFVPQIVDFLVHRQVLARIENRLTRPDRNDAHYLILSRLAHIAQPVLERYYMTFVVLWESGGNPLSEEELEQRCHLVAQKISMLYGINSPDFFDRQLFGHFIDTLFELEYIEKDKNGHLVFNQSFDKVNVDIRILLSVEVRSTILQLLNTRHPHDE